MNDTSVSSILEVLVKSSLKAGAIARACCEYASDESLAVTEKCGDEANTRFDRDFKTIADVLAQECARNEIASLLPALARNVRGEEAANIGGVRVAVLGSQEETAALLSPLVGDAAAVRLAAAALADVALPCANFPDNINVDASDVGVWIDPIDGTAEFIAGARGTAEAGGGLCCVTVLLGAYSLRTGEPLAGVVYQPFYSDDTGRGVWGTCVGGRSAWGGWGAYREEDRGDTDTVVVSGGDADSAARKAALCSAGWQVRAERGAGHKLLQVITGSAAAGVVWGGSTFAWDTCAAHAVLRACGGDVRAVRGVRGGAPLTYNLPADCGAQACCHRDGVVFYRNPTVYARLAPLL